MYMGPPKIHIQKVRASLVQERLGATQRALDALRVIHAEELAAERQTSETLRKKVVVYQERVRAAEMERDDMRAAVNELTDRVLASKDLSAWPCGQFSATGFLDPAEPLPPAARQDETMIYASALVASLATERDAERRAHRRTRRAAQNTIAVLEAQLAHREAELEDFLGPEEEEEEGEMSDEEALRILELNRARQRRIEMETRALQARLDGIPPSPSPLDALTGKIEQLAAQLDSFLAERQSDSAEPPREKA
ncbi:hypothetical protein F5146DRAFT_212733 [Armillaria mellea]|nr:hypothetical protein F5146DRAFT_212733 [Armillaria mellea]